MESTESQNKIESPETPDELAPTTTCGTMDLFGAASVPPKDATRLVLQARPQTYKRADSGILFGFGSVAFMWAVATYWTWMLVNGFYAMDPLWAFLWICATTVVALAAIRQTAISTIHYLVNKNWNSKNYSAIDILCSRSLGVMSRLPLTGPCDAAYLEASLAGARMRQGFCQSAEELLTNSISKIRREMERAKFAHKGSYKPFLGSLLINQSVVSVKLEKYDQAEHLSLEILELFKNETRPAYRIYKVVPMMVQASICLRWNEPEKAEEHINEAAAEFETVMLEAVGTNEYMEQTQSAMLVMMAVIRAKCGRIDDSLRCFDSFKLLVKATKSDVCTHNMEWLSRLSEAYVEAGKFSEAEEAVEMAYAAARELGFHPDSVLVLNAFEKVLQATERASEIADMRLWLRPSQQLLMG